MQDPKMQVYVWISFESYESKTETDNKDFYIITTFDDF